MTQRGPLLTRLYGCTSITRDKKFTVIGHVGNMGTRVIDVAANVNHMLSEGVFEKLQACGVEEGSPDYMYELKVSNKDYDSIVGA
jgi:hypothetical protein